MIPTDPREASRASQARMPDRVKKHHVSAFAQTIIANGFIEKGSIPLEKQYKIVEQYYKDLNPSSWSGLRLLFLQIKYYFSEKRELPQAEVVQYLRAELESEDRNEEVMELLMKFYDHTNTYMRLEPEHIAKYLRIEVAKENGDKKIIKWLNALRAPEEKAEALLNKLKKTHVAPIQELEKELAENRALLEKKEAESHSMVNKYNSDKLTIESEAKRLQAEKGDIEKKQVACPQRYAQERDTLLTEYQSACAKLEDTFGAIKAKKEEEIAIRREELEGAVLNEQVKLEKEMFALKQDTQAQVLKLEGKEREIEKVIDASLVKTQALRKKMDAVTQKLENVAIVVAQDGVIQRCKDEIVKARTEFASQLTEKEKEHNANVFSSKQNEQSEMASLEERLQQNTQSLSELKIRLKEYNANIEGANIANEKLKEEVHQIRQQNSRLQEKIKGARSELVFKTDLQKYIRAYFIEKSIQEDRSVRDIFLDEDAEASFKEELKKSLGLDPLPDFSLLKEYLD